MSGFGKCCDYLESHLLCDLAKVLTDKSQVCLVEPVFDTRILFAKRKNASWVLILGDFALESLSVLKHCGFLICFQQTLSYGRHGLTG